MLYVNQGFLPNYPYYLISDDEMFDAFLAPDSGFFAMYYPCPDENFRTEYNNLFSYISDLIEQYKTEGTPLPAWVYSYMLMSTVTYASPEEDIDDIYELAHIDNPTVIGQFNAEVADVCLKVSKKWLAKLPVDESNRPPTMFGEPHVIKCLRVWQANVLLDSDFWENF